MLLEESTMQSPEGFPLFVTQPLFVNWQLPRGINLDALGFDKNQARVDTLHLRDELFLADGLGVWLREKPADVAIISHPKGRRSGAQTCGWTERRGSQPMAPLDRTVCVDNGGRRNRCK